PNSVPAENPNPNITSQNVKPIRSVTNGSVTNTTVVSNSDDAIQHKTVTNGSGTNVTDAT
ncbi:hypothetical protein S245_067512, partial [Arachis hypogaea]